MTPRLNRPVVLTAAILICSLLSGRCSFAQSKLQPDSIAIVLDCSRSMAEPAEDGMSKMEAAKSAVKQLIAALSDGRGIMLIVYGHDAQLKCEAVEVVRRLTPLDAALREDLQSHIDGLAPVGSTPIALALETARQELSNITSPTTVLLITDGMENCKGEPAGVAAELAKADGLSLGIVGFGVTPEERQQLEKIAQSGNGSYYDAQSALELAQATQQSVAAESEAPDLALLVQQEYSSDNPLHGELIVNGTSVDTFKSNTDRPLAGLLQIGWNTITIKTTPQTPASGNNGLHFFLGPSHTDGEGRTVVEPVLWHLRNSTDWSFQNGKFTHPLGPNVKSVELTHRVYYAGLEHEATPVQEGDYVLRGRSDYSDNSPVIATVFVNGTPLNSFVIGEREVVITPLLKDGRNEIKLLSSRVPNAFSSNDIAIEIAGPAGYLPAEMKFEAAPVCQFRARQSWSRDKRTGQLVNRVKAGEETLERLFAFHLDADPRSPETAAAASEVADGRLMLAVEQRYSADNPLVSELNVNETLVDVFNSNRMRPVGEWVKPGWNTISIKTTPWQPANDNNGLGFRVGPVHYDDASGKTIMRPVLWSWNNDTDWSLEEGRFSHPLRPNVKDVDLRYSAYLGDMELEQRQVEEGDIVLRGTADYSNNSPLTATVSVNGTTLSSFICGERQVVITPLLKPGVNEITLVTRRVPNAFANNDITFQVWGPAEYNALNMQFEGKPLVEFKALEGWERHKRTGQLVSTVDPTAAEIKRAITFVREQ